MGIPCLFRFPAWAIALIETNRILLHTGILYHQPFYIFVLIVMVSWLFALFILTPVNIILIEWMYFLLYLFNDSSAILIKKLCIRVAISTHISLSFNDIVLAFLFQIMILWLALTTVRPSNDILLFLGTPFGYSLFLAELDLIKRLVALKDAPVVKPSFADALFNKINSTFTKEEFSSLRCPKCGETLLIKSTLMKDVYLIECASLIECGKPFSHFRITREIEDPPCWLEPIRQPVRQKM